MTEDILQILGGTGLLFGIVVFLSKKLVLHWLLKDISEFKTNLQRTLALEARRDAYKTELATRQLDAAQSMWSLFDVTSLNDDENAIVKGILEGKPNFDIEMANKFVKDFNNKYAASAGLYISRPTRIALHNFRNYIIDDMIKEYYKTQNRAMDTHAIEKFKSIRKEARLALRNEIGSENITLAKDEYTQD